jgi:hypothetical protein
MENNVKLSILSLTEGRSWLVAGLFVAGNIVVPQLVHLIPGGGPILTPIYFLVLFASMRYGVGVGLVTALLSPLVNHLLFGMPPAGLLFPIILKSTVLAIISAASVQLLLRTRLQ